MIKTIRFRGTSFLFFILIFFQSSNAQTFISNNLGNNSGYQFLGQCDHGESYRLVNNEADGSSHAATSIWHPDMIDLDIGFSIDFDIRFSLETPDVFEGADGICFLLQNNGTDVIGSTGGYLGYGGDFNNLPIPNESLAVEFDVFRNLVSDGFGDLDINDHTALVYNADQSNPIGNSYTPLGQLEDGNWHHVTITYDACSFRLTVIIDGVQAFQNVDNLVANLFNGNSMVTWGFTAAKARFDSDIDVCIKQIVPFASIAIDIPQEVCFGDPIPVVDNSSDYEQYQFEICVADPDGGCLWPGSRRIISPWIDGPIGDLNLEEAYTEWALNGEPSHNWLMWCNSDLGPDTRYRVVLNLRGGAFCNETVSIEEFVTVLCAPVPDIEIPEEVCFGDPIPVLDNSLNYDQYQFEICVADPNGGCLWPGSRRIISPWIDGPIGDLNLEEAYTEWALNGEPSHNWLMWCNSDLGPDTRYRIVLNLRRGDFCNETVSIEEFVTVLCAPVPDIEIPEEVCFGAPIIVVDNSPNYDQYQFEICVANPDGGCLWPGSRRIISPWIDGPMGGLDLGKAYTEWALNGEPSHNWSMWCNSDLGPDTRYRIVLNVRGGDFCNETVSIEEFVTVLCDPKPDYIFTDENGNIKTEFCVGEPVFLDATGSTSEEEWFLSIWKYEIGGFVQGLDHIAGGYCSIGDFTGVELGIIPLNPIWANCEGNTINFDPGFEYLVQLAVRNDCDRWEAKENEVFVVKDCAKNCLKANLSANLQWVQDAPNSILALGSVDCTPCNVVQFNWNFGDGNTLTQVPDCPMSFDEVVSHKYEFCGTYIFCVEMVNACPEICNIVLCEEVLIEKDCESKGTVKEIITIDGKDGNSSKSFKLVNSPNPFSKETLISYHLDSEQVVSLFIYDLQGNLIKELLVKELQDVGHHTINYGTDNLLNGTYICVFKSAEYTETIKLIKME